MIQISKEEFLQLQQRVSNPCVVICSKRKRSGGKTYWCAENAEYLRVINELRSANNE